MAHGRSILHPLVANIKSFYIVTIKVVSKVVLRTSLTFFVIISMVLVMIVQCEFGF